VDIKIFENVGSLVINGGLVGAVLFFGKKWMSKVEQTAESNRVELAAYSAKTHDELKQCIRENRDEYRFTANEIKESIDKLADHVAVANGRTGKLENRIEVQVALCAERRKLDACAPAGEVAHFIHG